MKCMKRNYLFYWFAVLLLLFSPARSYAEVYSGSCGENVNWTLDTETELLEITGSGEMEDNPWSDYRNYIKKCTIESNVTSISSGAFYDCSELTHINIPNSVTQIKSMTFDNCI